MIAARQAAANEKFMRCACVVCKARLACKDMRHGSAEQIKEAGNFYQVALRSMWSAYEEKIKSEERES